MVVNVKPAEENFDYIFSFTEKEIQQWKADFANYPVGEEAFYKLNSGQVQTPAESGKVEPAYLMSGHNYGNNLFMYLYRKIDGLEPETTYTLYYSVELASNAPRNSVGVGGSPGASVYLKAGAVTQKPQLVQEKVKDVLFWRTEFDRGQLAEPGLDMVPLGNIGTDLNQFKYSHIQRSGSNPHAVTTNKQGELWFIIGTESGFAGKTTLYYTSIKVNATKTALARN